MQKELECIIRACRNAGKAAAVIALTEQALKECIEMGFRLICAGMDVDHLEADYRRMRERAAMFLTGQPPRHA